MSKSKLMLYFTCLLSYLGIVILIPTLPSQVPIHFDAQWNVDGYGSKYMMLILGALPLIFAVIFDIAPKIDPRKTYLSGKDKTYRIMQFTICLLLIGMSWLTVLAAKDTKLNITFAMSAFIGVVFIIIGNYLPKMKWNYFLGIRTPWTLHSESCWRKTNRMGGYVFVVYGILMLMIGVISNAIFRYVVFGAMAVGIIGLILYSYIVYKRESR